MKPTLIGIFFLTFCALTCRADTHYVSLDGTNNPPYTNWAGAATNMQWAVDASSSSDTILVSNGIYYLTNELYFGATRWGSTLRSMNGRDLTIIDGGFPNITNRCIRFVGAVNTLDGFTIRNGFSTNSAYLEGGGGVLGNRTIIYNCRIINNVSSNNSGGGVYATGTRCIVTNCDIIGNTAYTGSGGGIMCPLDGRADISGCNIISNKIVGTGSGGGICTDYGNSISNCVIAYNSVPDYAAGGVKLYNDTIMRNCLVFGNSAKNAGGVYIYSAVAGRGPNQIENCTIVSNYASQAGGGLYQFHAEQTNHIENCIVYYNTAGDGISSNIYYQANGAATTGAFECVNTCLAPTSSIPTEWPVGVTLNNTGNIESDPRLVNYPAGNCRLAAGSPCVNAGTNRAWMTGAVDLDGRMRQRYGTVDMGAYEAIYGGTIFTGH